MWRQSSGARRGARSATTEAIESVPLWSRQRTDSRAFAVTKVSLPFSSTVIAERRSIVMPACGSQGAQRVSGTQRRWK